MDQIILLFRKVQVSSNKKQHNNLLDLCDSSKTFTEQRIFTVFALSSKDAILIPAFNN